MPKTPAERQRALYKRRKRDGLVLVRAWLSKAKAEALKRFIERPNKRAVMKHCEHLQLTKCDNDGDGTFYWICVEPGCDFSTPELNADSGLWLLKSTTEKIIGNNHE